MNYYIADLHFGYEKILKQSERPFASVEEMDQALVHNWNQVVTDEDTVYVIGDVGSYDRPLPEEYLAQLKGKKHLIRGNHDTGYEEQERFFEYFETVTDLFEFDEGDLHITLCHYPIVYIQGGFMIHGHIHNTKKEIHEILEKLPRVLNACVEVNDYRPVTLDELIENNRAYYEDPGKGCLKEWPEGERPYHKRRWKADFRPLPVKK